MADERFISKHSSTEIEAMLDKVKEDMRVIQYSQAEINTLLTKIDGMTQPTKVSDINNDLGFIDNTVNNLVHYYTKTNTYTKDEVNALITAQTSGGFISVNTLPTEDISVHHIYLVPSTNPGTNNIKDEYINLDGTSNGWELIGSTQLDLSNYVSVTALNSALLNYVTSTGLTNILNDYYTKTQVDGLFNGKADKVSGAISGHLAALDSNGNLTDAGKALSDLQGNGINIVSGYTPVGTVISVMGNSAPQHYLSCDGTVYNISSYPELAAYFEEQFGTKNHFGGDGTTTFAVPDLRGEFLRGTGTNSHENQGNGANVGTHQDGTLSPYMFHEPFTDDGSLYASGNSFLQPSNTDKTIADTSGIRWYTKTTKQTLSSNLSYTSRPTNTSVLYCIAIKNIYIDAKYDYSLDEKVVGTWFGKPLYQKTFQTTMPNISSNKYIDIGATVSYVKVVSAETVGSNGWIQTIPTITILESVNKYMKVSVSNNSASSDEKNKIYLENGWGTDTVYDDAMTYITLQYTKTTD